MDNITFYEELNNRFGHIYAIERDGRLWFLADNAEDVLNVQAAETVSIDYDLPVEDSEGNESIRRVADQFVSEWEFSRMVLNRSGDTGSEALPEWMAEEFKRRCGV